MIQSAHKTLNSLTQTAFMHISAQIKKTDPDFVDLLDSIFSSLTSTSPNAILLASLDATQADFSLNGFDKVRKTEEAVRNIKEKIRSTCKLKVFIRVRIIK